MNTRALAAAALLMALVGCGTGDKGTKPPTDGVKAPGPASAQSLAPLPPPPTLDVNPEALPGAGQDLTVVAARPQGAQQGEVRPTVTFSRPVKSLEMVESQRAGDAAKPFASIEPALDGEWRWLGSASVEFVPKKLVPLSTEYQVTVLKGLKALDGSELKADSSFAFSTPALMVKDVFPARGSRWLEPDDTLKLLFNQPVKDEDLAQHLHLVVDGDGQPWRLKVTARVSIEDERREAMEEAKQHGRAPRPLDDDERGARNQQMRYTLAPEKPLPLGRLITLTLDPELHGEQGALPLVPPEPISWRTYGPFALTSAHFCSGSGPCPYGPLILETSNELELATLKDKVRITPPVDLDWDAADVNVPHGEWEMGSSPTVTLPGKFKPGTTYQVTIARGAADVFKQLDDQGLSLSLQTADLTPALVPGPYLGFLEAGNEAPRLPVEVSNLKTLKVRMWKLSVTELVAAIHRNDREQTALMPRPADFSEDEKLKYPKNQGRVHPLLLSKVLGAEAKTGIALVSLTSPELEDPPKQGFNQLVQVSDLAAHIKIAPKSSLAWVTRVSTGAPVLDADVTVYDETGASLWNGKTNVDGFADLPGALALKLKSPRYEWEVPFALVVAQKDGDVSATANTWSSGVEPYEFGLSQGWEGERPESTGFLFTDRGIYRPGDTVYVKGVVRYRQVGELRAPTAGSSMVVKVTDSRGNPVQQATVKLSAYGTFSLEVPTQKDGTTGAYSVEAVGEVGRGPVRLEGSFRVEEFRPLQFRVDVEARQKDLLSGDPVEAAISARYLFGGAMSDAPVKWSVNRRSTSFAPDSVPGYSFQQETWWWDDHRPEEASFFFASGDGRVDAKGELVVKAGTADAPGGKPYEYTLEAEVTDVNRQAVAGRVELTVHPAAFYVGLRSTASFLQVGTEYPLDTVVVDPRGKRAAGRKVDVTVLSRSWKSVKKKAAGGGFETVSEPVEAEVKRCALTSTDSNVPCLFKPASAGFFIVRASVKDDRGRQHQASLGIYATGSDWVAWQRNDTDRVELIADKPKYDVGEIAKVLIKSPYPEAKALVTVEREGVLQRRLVDLKGSVVTVEVPITEAMVPNVYAGVLIMRPRVAKGGIESGDDPGRPNARIGLVKLNVEKKTKRLSVEVKADRPDYQPQQTVNVEVAVKDSAGKPASGEVTLYVVDEAVLRITSYTTPDPIAAIFPERPLSVRIGEPLLHLVRQRSYGEKGEAQGGGGGGREGSGIRSNFKTTVLFQTLEAKDGVAHGAFTLPDNLTTFRIMAVVVTQADRFGSGETSLRVNKPVMALPALPRFARVGDRFEAGVVVHSHGAGAGEVTVSAEVQGGAELAGPAQQKVQVAEGAPKEVRFSFKAVRPGLTTFRFRAANGPNGDGVEEKIPLELPVEIDAVAVAGDTIDVRVEGISPPKDVYADQGGLTVSMSSTALGNFGPGFQQLVQYPYGCLEQQASRLVPFIALRELAAQFGVPWPGADPKKLDADTRLTSLLNTFVGGTLDASQETSPEQVIAKTVRSIAALQNGDGSFRYWPEASCSSSWSSAYATLALARASDVGFTVPPQTLAKAEDYLAQVVGGKCNPCEFSCDDETRTFAAYVLARARKPRPSAYNELYARREKLSLFGRALLANAMFVGGGSRPQARALLQELLNFAKESPKGVHLEEVKGSSYATYYQSDTRTTGVVLQALTDLQPDHPFVAKMAQYLTGVRQGNGEWRSTQEAAFSLMALTEVVRTKEKETPDFKASLLMGAAPLFDEAFKGRGLEVRLKTVPMGELLAKAQGQEQKLTFKKEGAGVLYYSALLRYAPRQLPTTALDNGLFVQRWFEPWAGGGQATRFTAGELVRIRLRVASNQERHWTAFEVPLPAGLEPVDTSLATTVKLESSPGAEEDEGGGPANPWQYSFWSPFTHTDLRDAKVVVFADHLPPGVHVVSFVARATTPGTYVLKPARGALMYEPEVWGRSEGGTFEVVLPTTVSQK